MSILRQVLSIKSKKMQNSSITTTDKLFFFILYTFHRFRVTFHTRLFAFRLAQKQRYPSSPPRRRYFRKLSCSVTLNRNDKQEKYEDWRKRERETGPGQVCQFRGAIEPTDVLGKTWVSRFITSRAKVKSAFQTLRIFLQVSINFSTARLRASWLRTQRTP